MREAGGVEDGPGAELGDGGRDRRRLGGVEDRARQQMKGKAAARAEAAGGSRQAASAAGDEQGTGVAVANRRRLHARRREGGREVGRRVGEAVRTVPKAPHIEDREIALSAASGS